MSREFDQSEVLKNLDEVEAILEKAQIIDGADNSERKEWAGSAWEKADARNVAPNGTDWKPKAGDKIKRSLDDASADELEQQLAMRKSALPNPIAAEHEIMSTVPGVEKALCPSCKGAQVDAISKSACDECHGFGFLWLVEDNAHGAVIKSIEAKHNIGVNLQKAQRKNVDATIEEADTTPAKAVKDQPSKRDTTGEMVAKSRAQILSEMQGLLNLYKANGEEEEMEMDAEEPEDDDAEPKEAEASMDEKVMTKSFTAILKGLQAVLSTQGEMVKSIDDLRVAQASSENTISRLSDAQVSISKGLFSQGSGEPQPARAPRSAQSLTVIEKGFVDQAPSSEQPQFDLRTLKKGAAEMVVQGKLDRRIGLRLDAGVIPEEKIVKSIESFISQNDLN